MGSVSPLAPNLLGDVEKSEKAEFSNLPCIWTWHHVAMGLWQSGSNTLSLDFFFPRRYKMGMIPSTV